MCSAEQMIDVRLKQVDGHLLKYLENDDSINTLSSFGQGARFNGTKHCDGLGQLIKETIRYQSTIMAAEEVSHLIVPVNYITAITNDNPSKEPGISTKRKEENAVPRFPLFLSSEMTETNLIS